MKSKQKCTQKSESNSQESELRKGFRPLVDLFSDMATIKLSQVLKREIGTRKQTDVAKECGISKSLLNDWIAARRLPSAKNLPHLLKLARCLGLTLEQLLFDENHSDSKIIASTRFSDGPVEYRINIEKVK